MIKCKQFVGWWNSGSWTARALNASSVQGYAGAASAVAGAAQSSSGAGQVLGSNRGAHSSLRDVWLLQQTPDPDPASKTAQIATGNKLLLIGTLASIGGTVAGSNGKDLNSLSKEITDNPSYGGADGTGGGNCSGGIYDYADGCTGPPEVTGMLRIHLLGWK